MGASMLMIRPLLRANRHRVNRAHTVVFFIFLVSNIGGSLTPLGDPPLFLGFLHGVPFFWTLRLLPITGFVAAVVLGIYFILDVLLFRKEPRLESETRLETLRIRGARNLLYLLGIVSAVLASGLLHLGVVRFLGIEIAVQDLMRDAVLIGLGILSIKTTPKIVRAENEFTWGPIKEVAILFAGIFITIIPVLAILRAGADGHLGALVRAVSKPWQYFWMTGGLSSFLDNAPTYLTFMNMSLGNLYPGLAENQALARLCVEHGVHLAAISAGAVFMGAMTYIGNAPNFTVRSIAEEKQWKVSMPHFFGYMVYSIAVLIPVFILTTLIFF
jgi:Na+/H+ antiporter NhaD/arsenite permease-like protein